MKHPLFTTFSLFLTVTFLIFQINTDFLINQIQKSFYTGYLTQLLPSNKILMLSITNVFRKIDFLPHFYLFSQWMRCDRVTVISVTECNFFLNERGV